MKGEVQLQPPPVLQNPSDTDPLLHDQEVDESPGSSGVIKDEEDIEAGSLPCCRICLESDSDPEDELISPCMCKGTQQFVHRSCLDHWRSEGFAFSHCTTCKAQFHLRVELFEDNSWRKIKFRLFVARDVFLVFLAVQTVIAAIGGFAYIMDKDGSFRNSFDDGWDRILSKHPIPFYYCIDFSEIRNHIFYISSMTYVIYFYICFILCLMLIPRIIFHVISVRNLDHLMLHYRVLAFFVLIGFFGLILHCSALNSNDPRMAGCQNCCYGWGILDCFPASMEACFALVVVFVVIFAILGIAYGFLAATMAIQRIWQRHYHILTKRELTKEYIVEDLRGCYFPPKLDPEHEGRLKMLKLL
uniref:E3 ubiquitin-protein ligase MARCH1 n=1 Tax=Cajanus cajan TaxID=3821 RepID=A0A151S8N4_CAJCA|nr:E3 ubiquitin-protein ligase MARCH1 [Cajanus cajan]